MRILPHVSSETDHRAHQALQNLASLNRFRQQIEQLNSLKLDLAQAVMATNQHAAIERVEASIKSGQRQLENSKSLEEAIAHSNALLEEGRA